jgi:hypothetical protein
LRATAAGQGANPGLHVRARTAELFAQTHEVDRPLAIDDAPGQLLHALVAIEPAQQPDLVIRRRAIQGLLARARAEDEPAVLQIAQHCADLQRIVAFEAGRNLAARGEPALDDVVEHRLPQGAPRVRLSFGEPLQLSQVTAQGHAEHVGAHLAADALPFQLSRQIDEDLVRDMRDRSAQPAAGGKLRDQHGHLTHDRVDEELGVHLGASPELRAPASWNRLSQSMAETAKAAQMAAQPWAVAGIGGGLPARA